jgi:hypothetical protein
MSAPDQTRRASLPVTPFGGNSRPDPAGDPPPPDVVEGVLVFVDDVPPEPFPPVALVTLVAVAPPADVAPPVEVEVDVLLVSLESQAAMDPKPKAIKR